MAELTADPFVIIEERGEQDGMPFVIYRSVPPTAAERWVIRGRCSCCWRRV